MSDVIGVLALVLGVISATVTLVGIWKSDRRARRERAASEAHTDPSTRVDG